MRSLIVLFTVICLSPFASADSITFDEKKYTNVLVYETNSGYVVRLSHDGSTLNVKKENASAVSITQDYGARDNLLAQYEEAREKMK